MRKIRCPRCAVINMEGFTTFPYCAACGTRLPDLHDDHLALAWRRPLRSTLWAAIIGCAVLGLALYATNFFESAPKGASSLVLSGPMPIMARVGERFEVPLVLERAPAAMTQREANLQDVTLRLPRDLFQKFRLHSLQPVPDRLEQRGTGHYYHYAVLPADGIIRVTLIPLRVGVFRISSKIISGTQLQGDRKNVFETSVKVTKASPQTSPTR
jgi:hypothetical protein